MSLPLAGCRVLDLTRALAGPFCTMILADLGADVVKVEATPGGDMVRGWGPFVDGISTYYLSANRNKRSLAIDLRHPSGLATIRKLAREADVLVENFKPGTATAMGIGYDDLIARHPRLIYASISGFGRGGPYENWPGFDQIAQGMSGLMSLTGSAESGPTRVGIPVGDLTAGMWSAIGILAALFQRQVSGAGQRVDTSLLGSLIGMLCVQGQRYLSLGEVPKPTGNDHPVIAPYGLFETKNGPLNIAAATEAMWPILCRILGLDALVDDPRYRDNRARVAYRESLNNVLEERLRTRPKEEWSTELIAAGIPAGPVLGLDEVFSDPHVLGSGRVETVEHPTLGALRLLADPIRLGASQGRTIRSAPPMLGEHSEAILQDFGLDPAEIKRLVDSGVIQTGGCPPVAPNR
jgi:crotonobetainyl-CoA:carnitine CoA-transferase CaiB-like acyl-CoA transferase